MPGPVKQFVDFSNNTANDTGENTATSIQPILNGETLEQTVLQRPSEGLRQRTEAVRNVETDSLYLRDADRNLIIAGPGQITWAGSTTAAADGIPVVTNSLYILPMLTPGFNQAPPVPPIASAYGTLHLKRASDSMDSILVTSQRRSYAAGDQISVQVTPGAVFSCVLDVESGYQRTIKIIAAPTTNLSATIAALNLLAPTTIGDTALLVTAVLEGGALGTDLLLTTQAKQFVSGNYDGEGHTITPANLASFFVSNPTQALAEGDTLCVNFPMVTDTATTSGRRQTLPENTNTAIPAAAFFNSRVHPENLVNALPICKVVNNKLVFATGTEIQPGSVAAPLSASLASDVAYGGGGNWADGTTNPATTVEGQLDKIVSDLAGATGTGKIQGSIVNAGEIAAGTLATQIIALATNWLKLNRNNAVSGINTFSAQNIFSAIQDFQTSVLAGTGLGVSNAHADTARRILTAVPAKATLLDRVDTGTARETIRTYITTISGFLGYMVTMNAFYDNAAGMWTQDDITADSLGWQYASADGAGGDQSFVRFLRIAAGGGPVAGFPSAGSVGPVNSTDGVGLVDASGNTLRLGAASGILDFGFSSGVQTNPSSAAGSTNLLRSKNIPKCWGQLQLIFGGGVTVVDGFNVTQAVRVNGSYTVNGAVRVDIANNMNSAAYSIQLSNIKLNADSVCIPYIAVQTAADFTIRANDLFNVEVDLSANFLNPYIYFTVFGQQGT
jgi:hypothetical protein